MEDRASDQGALHGGHAAPTTAQLFVGFLQLGLMGFGGVLPHARRMIVERRGWMDADEFTDLLGLCQLLPGGNIMNLAVAIGQRFRGPAGACAAFFGLLLLPTVIVMALGTLYARFHDEPHVHHLFAGLAASASGLIVANALKIAGPLRTRPLGLALAAVCFAAIALLRLPLLPTMALLTPLSILMLRRAAR